MIMGVAGTPADRRRKYPWELWTDGRYHVIRPGEDFHKNLESMRVQLYTKAAKLGMQVSTRVFRPIAGVGFFPRMSEGLILFQFFPIGEGLAFSAGDALRTQPELRNEEYFRDNPTHLGDLDKDTRV